jgi:hypothetical protein
MAELPSSRRTLARATYTPIRTSEGETGTVPSTPIGRAIAKRAFLVALRATQVEIDDVREALKPPPASDLARAIDALTAVASERSGVGAQRTALQLASIGPDALVTAAQALIAVRRQTFDQLGKAHSRIWDEHEKRLPAPPALPVPTTPPAGWEPLPGRVVPGLPNATIYRRVRTEPLLRTTTGRAGDERGERHVMETMLVVPSSTTTSKPDVAPGKVTLGALLDWAIEQKVELAAATGTIELAERSGFRPGSLTPGDFSKVGDIHIGALGELVDAFSASMAVEPVGFLHLERLSFLPAGIERGELVYSVPLTPAEEVNIAHKEWSNTSEEFEKIVTDFLEQYSEEGVAEKSELAQSTTSESEHETELNTGVTIAGRYGPVSITATADYNAADSASRSEEFARNQSIAVTRQASSRAKKEQKVSFKVASASGTEDQTVRRIKNPFADRATRVDYYRLIRKWRVNLYRYGIRMTYDLTIPEPGSDVLSKIQEMKQIQVALEEGFDSPNSTLPWAQFDLRPQDVTRDNYLSLAAQYNASMEPPPRDVDWLTAVDTKQWSRDEASHNHYYSVEIDVPKDYYVETARADANAWAFTGGEADEETALWVQGTDDFEGKTGKLAVIYSAKYKSSFYIELQAQLRLHPDAYNAWRMKAWSQIRDAAQARYYENRQMLKERLERLMADLGAQDALSLRKFERDEVMKGVLRWLFGPSFQFAPSSVGPDLYGAAGAVMSDSVWSRMAGFGEMIKFLHHAIEWENVMFFLYPYFWSHPSRWEFKKYLDHPDPLHRAFLKAGSARVVLTIRPGFERAFASFVETGSLGGLAPDHPYLRIAEEIENYAHTNYPAIPPANPEEADAREQGVLIGTWFEFTPTSALDIAFDEPTPTA